LPDLADRETAVRDRDHNLCVVAGAGAGKTSLLVERILYAVLAHDVPLTRVIAITFTEKAAAELHERLLLALRQIREPAAGSEAERTRARLDQDGLPERIWKPRLDAALQSEAGLSTIHGFAATLLRRWPQLLGMPPNFQIDDGTRWRRFLREQLPARVRASLESTTESSRLWRTVLEAIRLDDVRALLDDLGELPEDVQVADSGRVFAALRPTLRELHRLLENDLQELKPGRSRKLPETLRGYVEALALALANGGQHLASDLRERRLLELFDKPVPSIGQTVGGIDRTRCQDTLRQSRLLLRDLLRVDEDLSLAILQLLRPLAAQLRGEFLHSGWITFQGLLTLCRQLLLQHETARREEAARVDLLLLDEFQDTDPLQCEIAFLLTALPPKPQAKPAASDAPRQGLLFPSAVPPDASSVDPWQAALQPGKLFLVGDPKQSIYRFRGADLEVYHRAVERVLKHQGKLLSLEVNFRSRASLVEPLNHLFADYIGPKSDCEPDFAPMIAARDAGTTAAVEIDSVLADREPGTVTVRQGRRAEGRVITAQIQELCRQGYTFGDMAILLRSLEPLPMYLRPLREAGIPCVVEGGRTFLERSEVNELLCLLRSLADPEDSIAFLGALRSSLFAVADAEILRFARSGVPFTWQSGLDASSTPHVKSAAQLLTDHHERLARQPAASVLRSLLEDCSLQEIAATAFDGAQRLANLGKLTELVEERTETLDLPFAEALTELQLQFDAPQGESESALADERIEAVRILSIHKAKGLEYPVVFLPDMGRQEMVPPALQPRVKVLRGASGLSLALSLPRSLLQNLAMVAIREKDRRHDQAETKRLLYVASTRARERLILVNHSSRFTAPWLRALQTFDYLPQSPEDCGTALAEGRVQHRLWRDSEVELENPTSGAASLQPWRLAVRAYIQGREALSRAHPPLRHPSAIGSATSPSAPLPTPEARSEGTQASDDATFAQALGIACHRLLEHFGPQFPPEDDACRSILRTVAEHCEVNSTELEHAVRELLGSAPTRRLLQTVAAAHVLARELPLLLPDAGRVYRGVADLVYRRDDELVVADYKTDREVRPEVLQESYAPQLSIYGRTLQSAFHCKEFPTLELLLLRSGRRQILTPV
jgi:ATP-dependent helicase/nuclease subunit A